ncbi:Golgi resident protein GCP60 [Octopus bimaculoides]|uniref:ACB domain-containing protein n=1 Tax=Octopus bimaculoides TaxID=37653 RepID=A0A0L8HD17_OCTBM|nr:Golgi resident protein GCP60 [Octopus bimaculoides]|eukprot:XP_014773365.1 PREDICTED: Golgi resident protein GCP60-like [Octopus bimaculoides]
MTEVAGVTEAMATTLRVNENESELSDASLDEDCVAKWGFRLAELYRLALLFFKDKQGKAVHLTYKDKLKLVAYTKQAAHGRCETEAFPDVGFLDVVGSDRRQAWRALGDMPQTQAMAEFVTTLDRLCPLLRPFVQAHRTERDDKLRKEQEELERKRLEEEERLRQEMEIEAARRQQLQREHQLEQEMQIRAALNQQTAVQFQQYAEAQYPKNRQQQEELIGQLQEQHFHQYMQQVYRQQLMHQQQQYIQLQSLNRHPTAPCYDNAVSSSTSTVCPGSGSGNNNNKEGLASSRTRGAGSKMAHANQFPQNNHISNSSSDGCGVGHDKNHNNPGSADGGGASSSNNNNNNNDNHWSVDGEGCGINHGHRPASCGGNDFSQNIVQGETHSTAVGAGNSGVGLSGLSAGMNVLTTGTVTPTAATGAAAATASSDTITGNSNATAVTNTQQGPPWSAGARTTAAAGNRMGMNYNMYNYNSGHDKNTTFNSNINTTNANSNTVLSTTTTTSAVSSNSMCNAATNEQADGLHNSAFVPPHAKSLFGIPGSAPTVVPSSSVADSTLQPHQQQHSLSLSQVPQPAQSSLSQQNEGMYNNNNNNNSYSTNNNNTTPHSNDPAMAEEVDGEDEAAIHGNAADGYGDMGELPPLAAASLWTRGEMKEFKSALSQEKDCVIRVGSGETVTVRVPTHQDGSCLFWEFATDSYDIGFGVYFEWTISHSNAVSIHVSDSSDPDDDEEDEDDLDDADAKSPNSDPEKGHTSSTANSSTLASGSTNSPSRAAASNTGPSSGSNQHRPPTDEIIPVYRRDSHLEVYCGNHAYPGRGVYLLKFDNSYSLWRSKTLYYRVYYTS